MDGSKYFEQELLKIKKGENSFLGMDGGNIKSDTWFCGVEFAGPINQMVKYYEEYIEFYEEDGLKIPYRTDCPDYFKKSTFDRFLTAMYLNILKDYKFSDINTSLIDSVLKNELYNINSKSFKLNLFPVAKQNISWDKEIEKLGYNKNTYYDLITNRANFIKDLVTKFEPKNIICFSPKGYTDYFIQAFLNKKQKIHFAWDNLPIENKKEYKILIFETLKTKVIIIPFLGRGNLNSYKNVDLMADYLKKEYL